jgi:hypothetical protein
MEDKQRDDVLLMSQTPTVTHVIDGFVVSAPHVGCHDTGNVSLPLLLLMIT